jgi:hypothetical protein
MGIFLFTTAYPASYSVDTRGSFLGGAGREANHTSPSSAQIKKLPTPNTHPWRGAQLKNRDNFYLLLYLINIYLFCLIIYLFFCFFVHLFTNSFIYLFIEIHP